MTFGDLIDALDAGGVAVRLVGDRLAVSAPPGVLTPNLREALAKHKPELMTVLAGEPETGYQPLDSVIVASEAARRDLVEIDRHLARVTAVASRPDATSLERQLVADWRAIRTAKAGRGRGLIRKAG